MTEISAPTFAPPDPPSTASMAALPAAWTAHLLGNADAGWMREGQRLAVAVGLASLFGGAVGLRVGGAAIAGHALGVSLGFLGVCGLAVPALAIVLALANASVDALGLARATSRAAANAGLLLAGLAPGAALFAVTVEDAITVTVLGVAGLGLAGLLAMRSFVRDLAPQMSGDGERTRVLSRVALPAFLVFSAILAARIWWVMLPIVRGE
jgi:hypothetical protein